jgi:hypothetical protein
MATIHTCLSADLDVKSVLGDTPRLYDYLPDNPLFPYITYGELRTEDKSGDDAPLLMGTLNLHLYSRQEGRAESLSILKYLDGALLRENLRNYLPGITTVVSRYTDSFSARDGFTRHSILRLSFAVAGEYAEAA